MAEATATTRDDVREAILVARAVRRAGYVAVRCAAHCLQCLRNGDKVRMETNQLKNLLEATLSCGDLRSIETWVLYQMGRDGDWRNTSTPPTDAKAGGKGGGSDQMFGHRVVAQFRSKDSPLRAAVGARGLSGDSLLEAELGVVRLFAGQLARLHKYADSKAGDWEHIAALAGRDE